MLLIDFTDYQKNNQLIVSIQCQSYSIYLKKTKTLIYPLGSKDLSPTEMPPAKQCPKTGFEGHRLLSDYMFSLQSYHQKSKVSPWSDSKGPGIFPITEHTQILGSPAKNNTTATLKVP